MTTQEAVLDVLRSLTPDKQKEVLDYARLLSQKPASPPLKRKIRGLWADLGIQISEKDIEEARKEMWGNFPREHPQ